MRAQAVNLRMSSFGDTDDVALTAERVVDTENNKPGTLDRRVRKAEQVAQ